MSLANRFDSARHAQSSAVERFVHPTNDFNFIAGESLPSHANEIHARGNACGCHAEPRQHIARGGGTASHHRAEPSANELVHHRAAADRYPIFNDGVPAEMHRVGKRRVIADLDIMACVALRHDVVVIADCRWTVVGHCAIDRDVFAQDVVVADPHAATFGIWVYATSLRCEADGRVWIESVAGADRHRALNPNITDQVRSRADGDCALDRAAWTDEDILAEFDGALDDRGGVDGGGSGHVADSNGYADRMAIYESSQGKPFALQIEDLGRMPYSQALERQRSHLAALVASREAGAVSTPMCVFLLEHDPPVITVSRRPGAEQHLLVTREELAERGIELHETDRGGDITWHGPGQVVAYPILDLNVLGLRIHPYMRLLESVVIETLAHFGVTGGRDENATGVWIDAGTDRARKIAALGVRLSHWCSMHGLALNVCPDLTHFQLIVPCGLVGRPVTSMRAELGQACPSIGEVKQVLGQRLRAAIIQDPVRQEPLQ